jgi:hypothetical protein
MDPSEKDALLHVPGGGLTLDEMINGTDKSERFDIADRETREGGLFGRSIRTNQFERLNLYVNAFKPPEIKFKDLESIVTTKLSFNLLPFDTRLDFIRVTEESVLTPITVELKFKDLAFQEQDGIYRAMANVYGKVTTVSGRVAQVFEDVIAQDIPAALFKDASEKSAVHQKVIPLRPGLYKIDLVIKDIHSANVGTFTKGFSVPRYPEGRLSTSSLILADIVEELPPSQVASGSFVLGGAKVRPNVTEEFRRDQELKVWLQVYNLKVDENSHKPSASVETLITRNGQEVKRIAGNSTELSGAAQQMTLLQTAPLADFAPGEYSIQVRVTDNLTRDVIAQSGKFTVR